MEQGLIKETGQIVDVGNGEVVVAVVRTSACQSCQARQGCGQAVLAEWGTAETQQTKNHFRIRTDQPMKVGDLVDLGMAQDTVSRVAALVYLLPLLTAFLGLMAGTVLNLSEGWQLVSLLVCFGAGLGLVRMISHRMVSILTPRILHLYPSGQASDYITSSRT